jgi:hypothetical protein
MLVNLDVLIGLAVIMLGVSLIVTIVNQAVSTALALRARNLKWGLSMLIQELHGDKFKPPCAALPAFGKDVNQDVANAVDKVLAHRLVSDSKLPLMWWRLASAIRFDEFLKVIHLLGESKDEATLSWLRENHRITEPWFNSVMDRVAQRFVMHMRIYSVAVAAIVVVLIGMDTLYIVKVLRSDAAMRSGLVTTADSLSQTEGVNPDDRARLQNFAKSVAAALPEDQSITALLFQPRSFDSAPGMLLSVILLSLGAPFWFTMLKNLTALRSVVARKEEKERQDSSAPDVGDRIRARSF